MGVKRNRLVFPIVFFLIAILLGAFAYSYIEGWNLLDSFYFVIITMTTVGYGDFHPITNAGKIFTMVFSIVGVAGALYFFSVIGSSMFQKRVQEKVSEIKSGVKKEEELKEEILKTKKKSGRKKGKK